MLGAYTGIYADRSPDGSTGPSFISLPYASIFGAMVAAPAIVAALFHRTRTTRSHYYQLSADRRRVIGKGIPV